MSSLLVLLIIILVIVIALALGSQFISGAYEPAIKFPHGRTEEFEEFINDDRYATAVRLYIMKNSKRIWRDLMPNNVYVTKELSGYSVQPRDFDVEIYGDRINKFVSKHGLTREQFIQQLKTAHVRERTFEDFKNDIHDIYYNEILENVEFGDKIIIPFEINIDGLHAVFILIDVQAQVVILINPHYIQFTDDDQDFYDFKLVIEDLLEDYLAGLPMSYMTLADYLGDYSTTCPVFQGSFDNDTFCVVWVYYLAILFVRNDLDEYQKIIDIYKRNNAWTQRQLQEFMFMIYKKYKPPIPKETPDKTWSLTGAPYDKSDDV